MKAAAWSHVFTDGSRFSRNSLAEEEAYPTEREQQGLRGIPYFSSPLYSLMFSTSFHHYFSLLSQSLIHLIFPLSGYAASIPILYFTCLKCCYSLRCFSMLQTLSPLRSCSLSSSSLPNLDQYFNLLSFSWRHGDSCTAFLEILQAEYWKLVDMSTSIAPQEMKSLEISKYLSRQSSGGHPQYRPLDLATLT